MNIYVFSSIVASVVCLLLAIFVYLKGRGEPIKRTFALVTGFIGIWTLFPFVSSLPLPDKDILFLVRVVYIFAIFVPSLFFKFMFQVMRLTDDKKANLILKLSYLISILFVLFVFNPEFIKGIARFKPDFAIIPGRLFMVFVLYFAFMYFYASSRLVVIYRKSKEYFRIHLKYVGFAFVIAFISGTIHFLSAYGIKEIFPHDILVATYSAIMAYAIIKYRLLDINIAVTRAGIFFVVYLIVLGLPFGIGYKLRGTRLWSMPLVAMALFATSGPFIYTYFRRKAEQRLRKEEFDAHEALNKLAQNMMRYTNLKSLLQLIVHYVVKILKVGSASVYLSEEDNKHYRLSANWTLNNTSPEQSKFLEDSPLVRDILLRRVPIVSEELRSGHTSKISSHIKKVQLELQRASASVVVPAFKGNNLFGFLLLSPRRDNRIFTQEDLNLLMLLANQSVFAIENARLVEKDKALLAEKSRRDALADMAPGVAHQFNNRLHCIATSADTTLLLLNQKPFEEFNKEELKAIVEETKSFLTQISKDAMKGKDIADAVLKKGRAKLTYERQALLPIIEAAILQLKISRTKEGLKGAPEPKIITDVEKTLPPIILNESLMQDIFYNIIDNGRDATILKFLRVKDNRLPTPDTPYRGNITISAHSRKDKVIITIKDDGIGMDRKQLKRLFVPFATSKATALKGTGLGLYTIRSFIEDHQGTISVESEYGKGTTFSIILPINPKIPRA